MSVRTDLPQVTALKLAVEEKVGHAVESRSDFTNLSVHIENTIHEHIAENTLRRIWGKLPGYETVFVRTLDVLSRYAGYIDWRDFCKSAALKAGIESSLTKGKNTIKVEDLHPGEKIRICWLPDRECILEYEGNRTFMAVDCLNSTIQAGDSFECSMLLQGYPLHVDNLHHDGKIYDHYSMGLDNGLTALEKITGQDIV